MRLVTGCNQHYYPRMGPYFISLDRYADFPISFISVGFEAKPPYQNITNIPLPHELNEGAPGETESIQHGSFLQVFDGPDDEVLIYTDGDFVMQRPMTRKEHKFLELTSGEVVASWNGGQHETLTVEAERLHALVPLQRIAEGWGEIVYDAPIYNVGFLAATRNTWMDIYDAYMDDWDSVSLYFAHMARQQWLISYEIAALGLQVKVAPWSLHAHGHFGLKPGMERRTDGIYHDGTLALFRHYL